MGLLGWQGVKGFAGDTTVAGGMSDLAPGRVGAEIGGDIEGSKGRVERVQD